MWLLMMAHAAPDAESVRDTMDTYWQNAHDLRWTLVRGNLAEVRTQAATWRKSLAPSEVAEADAAPVLEPLLKQIETSEDIASAARGLANLASACGGCHRAQGRTRSWQPPDPPGPGPMERHRAGADWMWAGIIASSDSLFDIGARTFVFPEPVDPLTSQLANQVERAVEAKDQDRASRYADILTTCTTCHHAIRGTRGPEVDRAVMHERLAALNEARAAVAANEVNGWRSAAIELAFLQPPEHSTDLWQPWTAELRRLGTVLHDAEDRRAAASALTAVAAHCGACHAAVQGGPAPVRRDQVDENTRPIDVLWTALLNGDDATWRLGAKLTKDRGLATTSSDARAKAVAALLVSPAGKGSPQP